MINRRFAKVLKQVTSRTVEFMVFLAEDHPLEKKIKQLFYTLNIGYLCIFLEHGEPLCVRASSHPGLRANCIYFLGYNFGIYDITTVHRPLQFVFRRGRYIEFY